MDPLSILAIGLAAYFLLSESSQSSNSVANNATNALSKALASLTGSATPAKTASSGGSGSGGGGLSGGSSGASAGNANSASSTGNAQVDAYEAALAEGDTTLADAIIGDDAPVDLESDPDPSQTSIVVPTVSTTILDPIAMSFPDDTDTDDSDDDGGDDDDEGD